MSAAVNKFETPLYTVAEASKYLGVRDSTFRAWAKGYTRRSAHRNEVRGEPVVTTVGGQPYGSASIPFVGLAEGHVLAGMREAGVPLQRIRPALTRLKDEFGLDHVLASKRLYTDGAEVLYDFGQESDGEEAEAVMRLVVARNRQYVFTDLVAQCLKRIDFASDGYAGLIRLPSYRRAEVVVSPQRGFGQPIFERGGARVEDALGMFWAGESLAVVAEEYGVPKDQLEDALRAASRNAA